MIRCPPTTKTYKQIRFFLSYKIAINFCQLTGDLLAALTLALVVFAVAGGRLGIASDIGE